MLTRKLIVGSLLLLPACSRTDTTSATQTMELLSRAADPVVDTSVASELSRTFRAAAAHALPAVAYIQVTEAPAPAGYSQALPFQIPEYTPAPRVATGSGVLYDARGYLLTNNHVAQDANELIVRLVDGREFEGKVVGTDPNTDIAVIRIMPSPGDTLPVAILHDSDAIQVGDWVLALGNPLGLDFTVTAGIVSAKGRSIDIMSEQANAPLEAFLQTDAAVNPGNSGGPLVDLTGGVVGINSAIASPTGSYAGYSFAIPINLARKVAEDLVQYGAVRRPMLGVQVTDATAADARVFHLPSVSGAVVHMVEPGSPAKRAGLRMGDVITGIDGKEVARAADLTLTLASHQPDDRVRLTLLRDGHTLDIAVTLGQFAPATVAHAPAAEPRSTAERLGFHVTNMTPQLADQIGLPAGLAVVISDVDPISSAAQAGTRPGMAIITFNGRDIRSRADLDTAVRGLKSGDVVSLVVQVPHGDRMILNFIIRGTP